MVLGVLEGQTRGDYFLNSIFDPSVNQCSGYSGNWGNRILICERGTESGSNGAAPVVSIIKASEDWNSLKKHGQCCRDDFSLLTDHHPVSMVMSASFQLLFPVFPQPKALGVMPHNMSAYYVQWNNRGQGSCRWQHKWWSWAGAGSTVWLMGGG